jgi:hypothetical protein
LLPALTDRADPTLPVEPSVDVKLVFVAVAAEVPQAAPRASASEIVEDA